MIIFNIMGEVKLVDISNTICRMAYGVWRYIWLSRNIYLYDEIIGGYDGYFNR